jgi:hypothetical protein
MLYIQPYVLCFPCIYVVCKPSSGLKDVLDTNEWKTYHSRLHVQYSLPEDKYKMFETCRR